MGRSIDSAGFIYPQGYLFGLTLSTAGASTTFTVAAGEALDVAFAGNMTLASSLAKTTSAWAVGAAAGSLDTGSIAASTWYHAYLIKRTDTGVVDVLISLSATAPTMPTNYTLKRRIGSMKTNGSSQWTSFSQEGDEFLWAATVQDLASTTISTVASTPTLTVPTGIKVVAKFMLQGDRTSAGGLWNLYASSPDQNDEAVVAPGSAGFGTVGIFATAVAEATASAEVSKRTNTSAQIRLRASGAMGNVWIYTFGWIDTRGKLS